MKFKLTDLAIRSIPIPEKGQKSYYDLTFPTLALRVSQGGTKTFVLETGKRGKRTLKTLGHYPALSLAEARSRARIALTRPEETNAITFSDAVQAYLSVATLQMSRSHAREVARILNTTFQSVHKLTLITVTTKHVTDIIDELTKTKPGQALHVHNRIKTFFRWCRMRNLLTINPVEFLPAPSKYIPRDRTLTDDELRSIWHACPKLGTFGEIVQCLILTGCRRNEVAQMRREWIQDDLLVIPKEYTKNGKEHVIPGSSLLLSFLTKQNSSALTHSLIFSSISLNNLETSFSAWSKSKKKLDTLSCVSAWTLHDLRRSYRTNLVAWKCCTSEIAELLIGHSIGSGLFRTYDRYDRLEEKRQAVARYESHLQKMLGVTT